MSVPKGYKRTEVGVIPEEWSVVKLRDCLSESPGYGINAPAVPFSDQLPAYIRITDISEEGRYVPERPVSVKRVDADLYYLDDGDIVFARTGASVGKSYLHRNADGRLVFAGFLIRVRTDRGKLIPAYLAALVTTNPYWSWVRLMSMRSGQPGINGREYGQLPLAIPPLPEQRAIAEAIGDVDALLGALDAAIAKQRDLKQAAMQQLLTGQTRLPGFQGEWEVKSFGDVFVFSGGVSASRDQLSADGHCYLHYGDIHTSSKTWIDVDLEKASIPRLKVDLRSVPAKSLLKDGDVVFVDASEDDVGTSKHVVVRNASDIPFISGLHTIVAKQREVRMARDYLSYCFQTVKVRRQFTFYAVGTKVSGVSKSNIVNITMPIPPKDEQVAIAAILSDMDAALTTLESRRAKTAALKQAMMQELLTGRTRLL